MASRSPGPESKPKTRGRGRGRAAGKQPLRSPGSESREDGGEPLQRPEDCIILGNLVVFKKQRLGGGAFGSVFKGTFGGQPCAVKVLHQLATQLTSPFPTAGNTQDKDLSRFDKECRLLESHNHRNIVRHMSTVTEPESNLPVLVMELMEENLTKFLDQPVNESSTPLSLQLQISLNCDVACGLQYLHSNSIVHQDLCSDNVLLKHEGSQLIAKVSDFGISRIIDPDNLTRSLRTVSHRDAYMPPMAEASASRIHDASLDIFSFGVVAVQVVMKAPTVAFPRDRDILVQKIEPSHPLRELIVCCLHKDKERRPKTSEVYRYLNDLFYKKKALVPLEESKVTIEVFSLPPLTNTGEIEAYFEKQGDNIEVLSTVNLGDGNARVELCGLTSEELEKLQNKQHQIKEQLVHTRVSVDNVATVPEPPPQPNTPDVHNAQVPDLEKSAEQYESNKLLVHQIPQVEEEHIQLFLENILKMDSQNDFVVEVRGGSAMITFLNAQFSCEGLVEMTSKIGSKTLKGVYLQAELCKVVNRIRVREVTKNYDDEFIQLYFENPKKSGGGKVISVNLLGNGEAIVTFQDPRVVESVLYKTHTSFGEKAVVEKEDQFRTVPLANLPPTEHTSSKSDLPMANDSNPQTANDSNPYRPVVIPIDPLVVKSLQKDSRGLRECVQNLKVDIIIDEKNKLLLITQTTRTIAGWRQEAEQLASSHINTKYKTWEITFPKEATSELMHCLVSLEEETSLASILSQESLLLKATGDHTAISMLQTRADEICSAYVQTSEKVELKEEDYDFFAQVKAPQCTSVHTDVSIQYDFSNHAIIVHGSVRSVAHFKQLLPEYLFHNSVTVELDPLIIHYLSTDSGRQQLNDFIQNKKCPVAVHFRQVPPSSPQFVLLFLCDPSQTGLTNSISRDLQEETSTKSQALKDTFVQRLSEYEEEYQQLCQDLQTQQRVKILTSDNIVTVAGFNKDVSESIQSINEFVQEKCNVTSSIEMKRGIWRLFCGPMHRKWQSDIVTKCKQNGIELTEPDKEDDRMIILVKGDATVVAEICQEIHDIEKSVVSEPISISRPGTCKYFQENEQAGTLLAGIEKTENVCIEKSEIDDSMIDDEIPDPGSSPGATKFTKVCMARTQEMKQILLYVGDITEFDKADVIVNAANGDLQHVGGVAGAIADKGGPIIQQESSQYVRRRGRLDDGDVWLTTKVGTLPCKALIHAVGPRWSGGHLKEEALLSKACTQSLQKAYQYRSIAFPAISSGIYGFPMDRCACTLVDAAVTFCKKNSLSELQEINFVVFKPSDAQAFVKALEAQFPQDDIFISSQGKSTYPQRAPNPGVETATRKKTKKAVATHQDGIILKQGSLTDVKADVYVNTTNVDLNLTQGGVAQALSKAAGPALQAECTKKAPISVGDIAVTGGGRLQCRYVFHTVAGQYPHREKQAEKDLRMMVNKCLKECIKLRMTSIAFPAIGTGNLCYPNDVVARIMIDAISSFLSSYKSSTLNMVYLVIFMTDTHLAFQQELAKQRSTTPETSYMPLASLPQENNTPRRSSRKRSSHPIAAAASPQTVPTGSQQTFHFGTIQVQVLNGDITDDSSDVIVNPTNSEIQLAGPGVSGALLRKGGEKLQKACNALTSKGRRLEEGKVLCTQATGALKCKFVFHILFESKDQKKFLKTITACLHKAEELKCNSIAFPAIGTGTHGYPPDAAAKGMIKAIDHFSSSKVTHITCVHVVLFQRDVYQAFVAVFNDPESLSNPGFWQRTKDFVGSFLPTWPGSTEDAGNLAMSPSTSLSYEQMMYRNIELVIYGETQEAVQRAMERLLKMIDDQFITDKVEDANVDKLSQSEIDNLEDISKQLHVEIDINPFPLSLIRLKGDKTNVHKMKCYVIETLAELEKKMIRQREAENMQKLVQWKRMDSQETPYDVTENYEIELAYKAHKAEYRHRTIAEHYTVDFATMAEIDHNSKDRFPVKRVDLIKKYQEGIEKPPHWDPMPPDPQTGKEVALHCVDLTPGSKEYNKVLREFDKTMAPAQTPSQATFGAPAVVQPFTGLAPLYGSSNTYNTIVKIQRIQNPMLYSQYIAKKKDMEKHNPPGHQNEWRLFHGTPPDVCPKINQQGFNRNFAGKNATMYGRGVYFARDASYSARPTYSPPDATGNKYMYFARVLAGEVTTGSGNMLVPPPKDPQDPNILFDSVVDNPSNPQIFVVFFDAQTYPEYLIVFN